MLIVKDKSGNKIDDVIMSSPGTWLFQGRYISLYELSIYARKNNFTIVEV